MAAEDRVNRSRAIIRRKFLFKPFHAKSAIPLASANLDPDEDLLVFERMGRNFALILRQMGYHHIAQGKINGEPYLVSF